MPEPRNIRHAFAIKTSISSRRLPGRLGLGPAVALLFAARLGAQTLVVPVYRVGDTAEADVVTPVSLLVFDAMRTDHRREAEAQKVPPIFRFDSAANRQAEEELKGAFDAVRARFLEGLRIHFEHTPPLLLSEVAQPAFREFVKAFQDGNRAFPLTPELAELWALGDPGDAVRDELRMKLRQLMSRYIRGDGSPELFVAGSVRLITRGQSDALPTLATVDKLGTDLARSNLLSLAKLRRDARDIWPNQDPAALEFVTGLVRPNCFFEEALTTQVRLRRTESINVVDRYEPGQIIVRRGEQITARRKLSLDELRTRAAPELARGPGVVEAARPEGPATEPPWRVRGWWIAGLGFAGAAGLVIARTRFKARRAATALPQTACVAAVPAENGRWRERALAAEARAQEATTLLRARLLPHVAHWMKQAVVQRLLTQQSEALTSQEKAERAVAELTTRLENLHAPLGARLTAYEGRIAELEAQLAEKGKENLELLKATIETTRKKLESERSQPSQPPPESQESLCRN